LIRFVGTTESAFNRGGVRNNLVHRIMPCAKDDVGNVLKNEAPAQAGASRNSSACARGARLLDQNVTLQLLI
jgi:hypothetical protein